MWLRSRSLKVIDAGAIQKLRCSFLFAFYSNSSRICRPYLSFCQLPYATLCIVYVVNAVMHAVSVKTVLS